MTNEKEYERFGPQWKAYVMKKSKSDLVDMYRKVCIELQQVKSVDLADVVCWVDMTEETPNLGDLILVRFPPEQRTRPVIIEFDELFEWIDGTQYIRL